MIVAGCLLAAAPAPAEVAAISVPIIDERGDAVYCTRDASAGRARPEAGGGYRFTGLRPGRWIVSIDLPHERIDVLVSVAAGGEVVVPPVVARGRCQRLALRRRSDLGELVGRPPSSSWALRYRRTFRTGPGLVAQGFRAPTSR